jgi:hypothetical protein
MVRSDLGRAALLGAYVPARPRPHGKYVLELRLMAGDMGKRNTWKIFLKLNG